MELGNYRQQPPDEAATAQRSSLSAAAFFASEDEASSSSLASSFFSHLPSTPTEHHPTPASSSSSSSSSSSFLRSFFFPSSSTSPPLLQEDFSSSSTSSPYRVDYISSAHFPTSNGVSFRKRWLTRGFQILALVVLVIGLHWFVVHNVKNLKDGLTLLVEHPCQVQVSPECKAYTFPEGLLPNHVEMLAYVKPNFLFRTNLPLQRHYGLFAYHQLLALMRKEASRNDEELPNNIKLYDISLMNPNFHHKRMNERCELASEGCWFESINEDKNFVNWPLFGEHSSPMEIEDVKARHAKAKELMTWSKDKLDDKVDEVVRLLKTPITGEPQAIFFHCHFGKDRTGLLSGGFRMKHLGQTLIQAWDDNKLFHADAVHFINGMLWYCYYLEVTYPSMHPKCGEWEEKVDKSSSTTSTSTSSTTSRSTTSEAKSHTPPPSSSQPTVSSGPSLTSPPPSGSPPLLLVAR